MKKISKSLLCVLLTAILLATSLVPSIAMSQSSWDEIWASEDTAAGLILGFALIKIFEKTKISFK